LCTRVLWSQRQFLLAETEQWPELGGVPSEVQDGNRGKITIFLGDTIFERSCHGWSSLALSPCVRFTMWVNYASWFVILYTSRCMPSLIYAGVWGKCSVVWFSEPLLWTVGFQPQDILTRSSSFMVFQHTHLIDNAWCSHSGLGD
jgi:hypothetical protein